MCYFLVKFKSEPMAKLEIDFEKLARANRRVGDIGTIIQRVGEDGQPTGSLLFVRNKFHRSQLFEGGDDIINTIEVERDGDVEGGFKVLSGNLVEIRRGKEKYEVIGESPVDAETVRVVIEEFEGLQQLQQQE